MRYPSKTPIVIMRRSDFGKLEKQPNFIRDKLIIRLPKKMGLRTGEVATLRCERIDLDEGNLWVLNSKKYHLYPLPIDWQTASLLEKQMNGRKKGYLLRPFETEITKKWAVDRPLSNKAIGNIWKSYARQADLINWKEYTPRLGRCYFIREWIRRGGDIAVLCKITRHTNLADLWLYANRLVFWEEIKEEYDRIQRIPAERGLKKLDLTEILENPVAKQCLQCPARFVCKYVHEAVESEWAEGCRFYPKIIEEMLAQKIEVGGK